MAHVTSSHVNLLPSRLSLSALAFNQIHPALLMQSQGRGLGTAFASPPIGNFTLPRRFDLKTIKEQLLNRQDPYSIV